MSAVLEVREPNARFFTCGPALVDHFGLALTAGGGVTRLRELILDVALRGKLSEQVGGDEPAAEYLRRQSSIAATLAPESVTAPFEVPSSWAWMPLGQLGVVGSSSRVHQSDWTTSGVPFYRAREVVLLSKHGQVQNELFISETLFERLSRKGLAPEEGDILLTGVGTIGVPYAVQAQDRFYFKDASVLIFKNRLRLNARYLTLCFRSRYWIQRIHENSMGTTVDTLTISRAATVPLPLPPIAEQARIVARVDELMRLCDALEEQGRLEVEQHARLLSTLLGTLTESATPEELAANWQRVAEHFDLLLDRPEAVDQLESLILDLAVQGKLVAQDSTEGDGREYLAAIRAKQHRSDPIDLLGDGESFQTPLPQSWAQIRLGEVIELISGQHLGPSEYSEGLGHGIPYLTGPAEFGPVSPQPSRSTRERRAVARRGDILVTVKGAGVGKLNLVEHEEIAISRQLMAVRVDSPSRDFIWLQLSTMAEHFREQSVGIAIPGIGRRDIEDALLGWPPLAEQRRIVARVTELRRLCASLRERLQAQQATQSRLAEALVEQALA